MFGWFTKKNDDVPTNLCIRCAKYKKLYIREVGGDYCISCGTDVFIEVQRKLNNIHSAKIECNNTGRGGHLPGCVTYNNSCYHLQEYKDKCPYGVDCEFNNPIRIICIDGCQMKV